MTDYLEIIGSVVSCASPAVCVVVVCFDIAIAVTAVLLRVFP